MGESRYPTRPTWHPILACVEYQPGRWVMVAQYDTKYAHIMLVRRGQQVGYRVDTWHEDPAERRLIGHFLKLTAAAKAGHQSFLSGHTSAGAKGGYQSAPAYGQSTTKANTPARIERD